MPEEKKELPSWVDTLGIFICILLAFTPALFWTFVTGGK